MANFNYPSNHPLRPIRRAYDTYEERMRSRLFDDARKRLAADFETIENVSLGFVKDREPIVGNRHLSPLGQSEAVGKLTGATVQALKAVFAKTAETRAKLAETKRDAPYFEPNPEHEGWVRRRMEPVHTAITELRQAEIRGEVRRMEPLQRQFLYENLARKGNVYDEVFQAFERAPAVGEPLVPEETRQRALDILVENSALAPEIRSLESEVGVREALATTTRSVLRDLGIPDSAWKD